MIVSINQPAYLPWLGYFHRIAISDVHIVLDDVQFSKNSFTNRNKIRTKDGWVWLTVPVATSGRFTEMPISEIDIVNTSHWAKKHWLTMSANYSKAPFFSTYAPFFKELLNREWDKLNPMMREITNYLLKQLNICTPIIYSSDMKRSSEKKEALILSLCINAGASIYLSGPLGRNYLDEAQFRAAGIEITYQDYDHPVYSQNYPNFEPYMAVVDLLFNHGPDSFSILMKAPNKSGRMI